MFLLLQTAEVGTITPLRNLFLGSFVFVLFFKLPSGTGYFLMIRQMKVYLVWLNTGIQHQNFPFLKTEKMKKLKTGLTERMTTLGGVLALLQFLFVNVHLL